MNTITNRQVICDVLLKHAKNNREIVVLCSDSRGSASLSAFAAAMPGQFVEVGIAEQSLVSIAAGLAVCGKRPFAASPASFLSTRSIEQIKVDVAYSGANVKLIGISGGISYGALGMTHHSAQDIAAIAAIPGMRIYLPSDRFQTEKVMEELIGDNLPAYIRTGRNPVEDVYSADNCPFVMDKATILQEGRDITIIACGEMVFYAKEAGRRLAERGVSAGVIDMYCIKPLDKDAVLKSLHETKGIITIEEHSPFGGMGSMISQIAGSEHPVKIKNLALPDAPVITGNSREVFDYYNLNAEGIIKEAMEILKDA